MPKRRTALATQQVFANAGVLEWRAIGDAQGATKISKPLA